VRNNPITANARKLDVPLVANVARTAAGISGRRGRHRVLERVAGSVLIAAAAGTSNTISTANDRTCGAGAYWASRPASNGPMPRPPTDATVDTSAALRRLPVGSSSVSAAVNGPEAAPSARPCRTRAANSHAVFSAVANTSDPSAASATAGSSTARRPIASDNVPATSSEGMSTAAYAAKMSVTTSGENPNVAS
jgi:hypothetical protein